MSHFVGRCSCGKKIHFPRNAKYGYEWECYKCGQVWVLDKHGKQLHIESSRPYATKIYKNYDYTNEKCICIKRIMYIIYKILLCIFKKFWEFLCVIPDALRIFFDSIKRG